MPKPTRDKFSQILSDVHNHNCNYSTREIFAHGYFGSGDESEGSIDYRQSVIFEKNIRLLEEKDKSIIVHFHSMGGDWNDGMAMYDIILTSKSPIAIIAYAHSRSMSSIILQSANLRILMPNCEFMIHHGTASEENTSLGFISSAEMEKKRQKVMLEIYAKKCIKGKYFSEKKFSIDRCMTFLDNKIKSKGDWWLSAEEAIDFGFADAIFGSPGFSTIEEIKEFNEVQKHEKTHHQ